MTQGLRIYNLFPTLVGPIPEWARHLERIAGMGFTWIYVNPFHEPGFSGSLYAVKDYYRLNPALFGTDRRDADELLGGFVRDARRHGIDVMMDLVANHTSKDADLAAKRPEWYRHEDDGSLRSPRAVDPDDQSKVTVWGDLAELDYAQRPEREALVAYVCGVVRHYVELGFRGFRCDAAYQIPGEVWGQVIASARALEPETLFVAETLGCRPDQVEQLAVAGFDYLFNSSKWWDFRADWLLEQYEAFRHIAPSISFPESHDTPRLVFDLETAGITNPRDVERAYRQRYLFAAFFSSGVMMPIGFEFGFRRKLDVVRTRPDAWEAPRFDLSEFIREVNALKARTPALEQEGPQRRLSVDGVVALLRETEDGAPPVLGVLNPNPHGEIQMRDTALAPYVRGDPVELCDTDGAPPAAPLPPLSMRVFGPRERGDGVPQTRSGIVIESVYPELDGGRHPIKREVGDALEVWADIFKEGHDVLAACLKIRRKGLHAWREIPMRLADNDRWRGSAPLDRNARYLYTIEAWIDRYGSWRQDTGKKREAGQSIALELLEGRALVAAAMERATGQDKHSLEHVLSQFDGESSAEHRAELLLSEWLAETVARNADRADAVQYDRELEVVVDRPLARFAAWYELFPRSQGRDPGRSGTFDDCIARLPDISAMGFDVLYFPPIHPIGRTHRKGRNNTLTAEPGDPGSPYAIGSAEGGHTAIHPELGSLEDFHRLVAAARAYGIEIALDFALQCAPDHPYVREHQEWFTFRPDGSIKYAENPPKKYQDIANFDFGAPAAGELWLELRNVLLYWVDQGVKIFRVDNPHTKPVTFWRWVIDEVQARHPDVIFLSEAFTRPKMLKHLAKVGFTQSYTYFTWRTLKSELTEYLTELTQSSMREYLRPNFFANTPDILSPYLQTGGRSAFCIRFVLAATLSSLYGIYSGFELCENTPIPGTEEYLHAEKYEIKVRDWDAPGNIKGLVSTINRIRRENPALHETENLRFYHADDPNVIFYGKMTLDRSNAIFVAVNLDPFETHRTVLELSSDVLGLTARDVLEVEELIGGARHLWQGTRHEIELDPAVNPAAILRITGRRHVDYEEPSL